jgi:hypothetical protein
VKGAVPAPPGGEAHHRKETRTMQRNEGTLDRALRIAAGLLLIGLTLAKAIGPWGWIGVVPLLTGAVGLCPLYTLLRINTCPLNRR